MIIKLPDGTELDTEKMSDIDSLVMEKMQELSEISQQYKVPLYCAMVINDRPTSVYNFVDDKHFLDLVGYTAFNFTRLTNGKVKFYGVVQDDTDDLTENNK